MTDIALRSKCRAWFEQFRRLTNHNPAVDECLLLDLLHDVIGQRDKEHSTKIGRLHAEIRSLKAYVAELDGELAAWHKYEHGRRAVKERARVIQGAALADRAR